MKKYLLAATLIVAFSVPASAATFYVIQYEKARSKKESTA